MRLASERTATALAAPSQTQTMDVNTLGELDVYNARGDKLGHAEAVIADDAEQGIYVMCNLGRGLDVRAKQAAVPLERMALHGNRPVIWELSNDALRSLPVYWDSRGFHKLDDEETIQIGALR